MNSFLLYLLVILYGLIISFVVGFLADKFLVKH